MRSAPRATAAAYGDDLRARGRSRPPTPSYGHLATTNDHHSRRHVKPSREAQRGRRPQHDETSATLHKPLRITGTVGHLHAYFPLREPVDILAAEAANRRLAAELGADTGAVTNAATILRPPGTYSFKTSPPVPVVLERLEDHLSTAAAVTAGIAADPAPPAPVAPAASTSTQPRAGHDPLRALDPAHYVSVLTGQVVGRSRKICCPFHEDRTPSFHVYEHAEDGWYCFGTCKRHGHTVYDLAGALWGLQTRGPDFLELRQRLYELFLPGQTPPKPPRRTRTPSGSRA